MTFIHPKLCSGLSPHRPKHSVRLLMEAVELCTAFPYGKHAVRAGERGKHLGTGHAGSCKARGPAEQMARK